MISGFWNTQIAAGSTSNTNSIDAVREREKFVNSMDIFAEGWNDPWTIWVSPNYDGTTITRPT